MRCGICLAQNSDGEIFCLNCGQQLKSKEQNKNLEAEEIIVQPLTRNNQYDDFFRQVISEPLWSERQKEMGEAEEISAAQISSLDSFTSYDELNDKDVIIAIYEKLINVIVEDSKNISFIVAGTMEGNAANLLKEKEKKWVNLFLNARPEQLSEDGLVVSPQAVGELEMVFEKARDLLADKRYSGARSIIEDFLKWIRQVKEYTKAPSQVSRR
ncbi:hypothetical protein HZB05_00225 [Candidatus Wolfebacteria bacterium]|nr:hypothetical protein [Candidatus Wolfebacteria bacterium]